MPQVAIMVKVKDLERVTEPYSNQFDNMQVI